MYALTDSCVCVCVSACAYFSLVGSSYLQGGAVAIEPFDITFVGAGIVNFTRCSFTSNTASEVSHDEKHCDDLEKYAIR